MIKKMIILLLLLSPALTTEAQTYVTTDLGVSQAYILKKINNIRTHGCKCGRKRMKSVNKLTWSETLAYSAALHAGEMDKYDYFAHRSKEGLDVGDRLDEIGYKWQYVGENLAIGQKTFDEALKDWMDSDSHCKMIMNSDMKEMGLSRVGKYWVNHFGAVMPPKTKRVKTTYREG